MKAVDSLNYDELMQSLKIIIVGHKLRRSSRIALIDQYALLFSAKINQSSRLEEIIKTTKLALICYFDIDKIKV